MIDTLNKIKTLLEQLIKISTDFFKAISKILFYLTHPKELWTLFYNFSFIIAIVIGGLSIIFWFAGWKKGIRIASVCVLIAFILRIFNIFIGGN